MTSQASLAWSWGLVAIGLALVLLPLMQGYVAVSPWIAIADFVPMEMIVDELVSTLKVTHAAAICGLLMVVGGILLIFQRKIGWVLGMATIMAGLFWALEGLVILLSALFAEPKTAEMTMEVAWEFLQMTYFLPVVIAFLELVCLVALFLRPMRSRLTVHKRHIWWAVGIAAFLLIEQHLSLWIFYLQNQ